jgi:hypothetical protein
MIITPNIEQIIKQNIISKQYPKLNFLHKELLYKYFSKVLEIFLLVNNYSFETDSNKDLYIHEFIQNDSRSLKWLCSFLLPYIDVPTSSIESFDEIYTKKSNPTNLTDILPTYIYSNIQYGRCIRGEIPSEIPFIEEHLRQNALLLCTSIIESSNKLYVNWMDLMPYTLKNYTQSQLFKNTYKIIEGNLLKDTITTDLFDMKKLSESDRELFGSLYVGDIYMCIRNYLYEDIKHIKLLIYDMGIEGVNNIVYPCLYILGNIMPIFIKNALNNKHYDKLSKEESITILSEFETLRSDNSTKIKMGGINFTIKKLSIQRLLVSILYRFNEKYRNNDRIKKDGYKEIKKDEDLSADDDDDEDTDEDNGYDNYEKYKENIMSIPITYIYEYFQYILQQFKNTFYSTGILNIEKTEINERFAFEILTDNKKNVKFITLKNFYNFAKSLSIEKWNSDPIPKPIEYPLHWKSLEIEQKKEILARLNNENNPIKWFNIKKNIAFILKLINENKSESEIIAYNIELYRNIKKYLIIYIFQIFISKGLLTKFFPNKSLTDTSMTPRERNLIRDAQFNFNPKLFSKSKTNEYWTSAYSYLTELPYCYSGSTFDAFRTNAWYSSYALDWVSQIGFCHKFISQRVTFITGGTGVGKSTQIPKLYIYYLKALDYNGGGKLACTQPRKAPTSKNAETVSKELGFDIKYSNPNKYISKYEETDSNEYKTSDIDSEKIGMYTDSHYVQMEYKEEKHTKKVQHLVLKYLIDATLVNQLKDMSILLKPLSKKNKLENISIHQKDNLYDVVIIDESHEHNINMDLLLTILRDYIYFNPSLRLVILSATMTDDEPTYRRFYRDINDNQKYPYDCFLRDSNLDRINIDRRFHISPPGYGTSFSINETYDDTVKSEPVDIPNENIIAKVNDLIKEGLKGDILIFCSGESDIKELVTELNLNIPDNIIALPFYSKLKDDKKNFITDIDTRYKELRITKKQDFGDDATILTEGINLYDNFIICATNMAEASITINRLYTVIETGTRKSQIYSYKQRQSKLVLTNISESSRLQRKGRVGRTGPGHVYYMYQKGLMSQNKILFEIASSNISQILMAKLTPNTNAAFISIEDILNYIKINDKNNYKYFERLYKINNKYFTYEGNKLMYDYSYEMKYSPKIFNINFVPKYSSSELYDKDGHFYIVHPDELLFDRDIMGRIIKIRNSKEKDIKLNLLSGKKYGLITSEKINSFIDDLSLQKYIKLQDSSYIVTDFGLFLLDIETKIDLFYTETLIKPLIYSILLKSSDDVLRICSLLDIIDCNCLSLINPEPKSLIDEKDKYNLDLFKKNLLSKISSSEFDKINTLAKDFLLYLNKKNNFNNFDEIDKIIAKDNNIDLKKYYKIMDVYEIAKDDDTSNDVIDRTKIISMRIEIKINTPAISADIEQFCSLYNIKPNIMKEFIKKYYLGLDLIKSFEYPDKRKVIYQEKINIYSTEFNLYNKINYDIVLLAFLFGSPFNIAKRINNSERYILVYNPISENMFSLNTDRIVKPIKILGKKTKIKTVFEPTILIDEFYLSSYVFYFTLNQKNCMVILANLSIEYFKLFNSIYNSERLNKISSKDITKIDSYISKLESKNIPQNVVSLLVDDDIKGLKNVKETYKEILKDLI